MQARFWNFSLVNFMCIWKMIQLICVYILELILIDILGIIRNEMHIMLCKIKQIRMYVSFKVLRQNWGMTIYPQQPSSQDIFWTALSPGSLWAGKMQYHAAYPQCKLVHPPSRRCAGSARGSKTEKFGTHESSML